jgi:hypothetical protein
VIHNGPIPYFVHGVIDYLAGVLLVAAPFLLGFSGTSSATAVSVVLGVLVLVLAASTDGPTSLTDAVPIAVHVIFDVAVGIVLIAAPFVLSFTGNGTATPFFIVLGVFEILVVVGTRFPSEGRTVRA